MADLSAGMLPAKRPPILSEGQSRRRSSSFGRSGGFGGAEVGYNVMVAPHWLLGVEADASAAAVSGTGKVSLGPLGSASTDTSVNMISTHRGRLGYTFGNLLIYGTGGVALTGNESTTKIATQHFGTQSSSARGLGSRLDSGWRRRMGLLPSDLRQG